MGMHFVGYFVVLCRWRQQVAVRAHIYPKNDIIRIIIILLYYNLDQQPTVSDQSWVEVVMILVYRPQVMYVDSTGATSLNNYILQWYKNLIIKLPALPQPVFPWVKLAV